MKIRPNPWLLPYVLLALAVLGFVAYKAYVAAFTHDEAFTFQYFFHLPELDILRYHQPAVDAQVLTNNHIFNTYMMKLSESIFGLSEWSLRLPNVLALLLYLGCGYRLLSALSHPIRLAGFVLLFANPYLLDFFGLARGYGLSIGFMTLSLYTQLQFFDAQKWRYLFLFHLAGILSVLSNFATINYYAVGLALLYVLPILRTGQLLRGLQLPSWRFHLTNLGFVGLLAGLLYLPFLKIIESEAIYFGGKGTFFAETIGSLVRRSAYETPITEIWVTLLSAVVLVIVLGTSLLLIRQLLRQDRKLLATATPLFVINAYTVLIPVATIVQHYLFGQDYLVQRFAIFLYPLFALNLIFLVAYLSRYEWLGKVAKWGLIAIAVLMLTNVLINVNTNYYYYNWKYDKDNKVALRMLQQAYDQSGRQAPLKLGVSSRLEPSLNFYRDLYGASWLQRITRDRPKPEQDYWYIIQQDLPYFPLPPGHEVIVEFANDGGKLVRLKPASDH